MSGFSARAGGGSRLRFGAILMMVSLVGLVAWSCLHRGLPAVPTDSVRNYSNTLPVFPGAEGFGTNTWAGRFGEVVKVINLAAAGPGSLRRALARAGRRIVVFEVAGVIDLSEPVVIDEPYVTVAGQTAPSPGITVIGAGLVVATHDVLVQHLRFRIGDRAEGPDPGGRDGISVVGRPDGSTGAERVVIDHCSASWALDEGTSIWYAGAEDITFRHCIIAENLSRSIHPKGEHSKGLLIGDHAQRVSVIGNLFAHNTRRSPLIKGDVSALVVNNLIYDPGTGIIHFSDPEGSGPSVATVVGNVLLPGPDTSFWPAMVGFGLDVKRGTKAYLEDNASGGRAEVSRLNPVRWFRSLVVRSGTPPVWVEPLTVQPSAELADWVLVNAGARPADRDATDVRIVRDVRTGAGSIIDSQEEVGGFPSATPVVRPLTIPEDPSGDTDGDGFTNIEEWLRQMAADAEGTGA